MRRLEQETDQPCMKREAVEGDERLTGAGSHHSVGRINP